MYCYAEVALSCAIYLNVWSFIKETFLVLVHAQFYPWCCYLYYHNTSTSERMSFQKLWWWFYLTLQGKAGAATFFKEVHASLIAVAPYPVLVCRSAVLLLTVWLPVTAKLGSEASQIYCSSIPCFSPNFPFSCHIYHHCNKSFQVAAIKQGEWSTSDSFSPLPS